MNVIPTGNELVKSTIVTLGGVLLAALILSRFPQLRAFVAAQSITVKDEKNNVLYF